MRSPPELTPNMAAFTHWLIFFNLSSRVSLSDKEMWPFKFLVPSRKRTISYTGQWVTKQHHNKTDSRTETTVNKVTEAAQQSTT